MFHDREAELEFLFRKLRRLGRGELIIIYGRRRVGKTELVKEFLRKAGGIYLYVDYCEPRELLSLFSKDVREQTGEFVEFGDWDMFFAWLSGKRVVVMDEFQRLHATSPQAITRLQRRWDENLKSKRLMLILVGSSIGMLRKVAMGSTAPLYGRATGQLKLQPFPYSQLRKVFKEFPEREKVAIYGIFGGTPHYFQFVRKPLLECVRETVLEKGAPLFEEPLTLLRTELKEVARYNSILVAIAEGKQTLKEISDFTGVEPHKLTYYLENLRELLDLVEIRKPVLGKERMGRYELKDNFFRFWYSYVFPDRSVLERGEVEPVLARIGRELDAYLGPVFERVVRELLIAYNHRELDGMEVSFKQIGAWWDRAGNEIDVCAWGDRLLLGEVKWKRRVGSEVIDSLLSKAELVPWRGERCFLVASAGGFTPSCRRAAEREGVLCLNLAGIERLFEKV